MKRRKVCALSVAAGLLLAVGSAPWVVSELKADEPQPNPPLRLQPLQPLMGTAVTGVEPNRASLLPGGAATTVTLQGRGLDQLYVGQVTQGGKPAPLVKVTLGPAAGGATRQVTLAAAADAVLATDYQLWVYTRSQAIGVPPTVLSISVLKLMIGPPLQPVQPVVPQGRLRLVPLPSQELGKVQSPLLAGLSALCESEGKLFGAGGGKLLQLAEGAAPGTPMGQVAATPISIPRPLIGLSRYLPGSLLAVEGGANTVHVLDTKTGRATKLFALGDLKTPNPRAQAAIGDGQMSAVAFDGRFVYVAVQAGYSSSILKISAATKQVVDHAWAPGPEPVAMMHDGANLFVVDGVNNLLRRYDARLQLNDQTVQVPPGEVKGLVLKGREEFHVFTPGAQSVVKLRADLPKLQLTVARPVWVLRKDIIDSILPRLQRRFAVLICGDVAESGYREFWYDTVWLYKTLRAAGYSKENIYVLYGDGLDYANPNPFYSMPGETVTDFPATRNWVYTLLDGLKNGDAANGIQKMNANDTLFVWTFDHGGGTPPDVYLCLRDLDVGAADFSTRLNQVPYKSRVILMQQCRSGGFIPFLQNNTTFISTACRGTENAHPADTEKELFGGVWYTHGEYDYYIISSLAGTLPTGAAVNADSNNNGHVSLLESHNWNVTHENRSEVPQSNDMGGVGTAFQIK